MPATHIALLRGINVGTAKRVSMSDLRAIFESVGCTNVRTLLNSGNVVFAGSRITADRMEKAIEKKCGFASRVTILSDVELRAIVAKNPFEKIADNPSRYLVAVMSDASDCATLKSIAKQSWKPGAMTLGDRWAYLWCPDGILDSKLAIELNRLLKDRMTARNWATITKLHAML